MLWLQDGGSSSSSSSSRMDTITTMIRSCIILSTFVGFSNGILLPFGIVLILLNIPNNDSITDIGKGRFSETDEFLCSSPWICCWWWRQHCWCCCCCCGCWFDNLGGTFKFGLSLNPRRPMKDLFLPLGMFSCFLMNETCFIVTTCQAYILGTSLS